MQPEGETPPEQNGHAAAEGAASAAQADTTPPRSARRAARASGEASVTETRAAELSESTSETGTSSSSSPSDGGTPTAPPVAVLRAEQMLDEALVWGAAFGTVLAQRVRKLVARAREEVEDLVAEAEAVRSQWRGEVRRRSGAQR
ncbi:hypothetical protein NET03_08285 [Thermomicrobium sp. CFH 73360]|uniref:hypothetical protein n=1 Tax=Thermomicrobium sp. CFH 73360 TaxID=2951987 RepID=UPI002077045D|nr:hypothetical protein [Thermomicrobium sp. CFH 73360]MCM8746532.1 hypothetical protein [Thermomicrobium sp. CFH 73360]